MKNAHFIYLIGIFFFLISCKEKVSTEEVNKITKSINYSLKQENEKLKEQLKIQESENETYKDEETIQKPQAKVYVKNREQFFSALRNDTEIFLTMDSLDLSFEKIKQYAKVAEDYTDSFRTEKLFINEELILANYDNLTITSTKKTVVFVNNSVQDILIFYKCKNIKVSNISVYHKSYSTCFAKVLVFKNSENIKVTNSELNGSGDVGLSLENTKNVRVENTKIYNNSINAIELVSARDVYINECQIYKNNCSILINMIDSNCRITNTSFSENKAERFYLGTVNTNKNKLSYSGCNFTNNEFEYGNDDFNLNETNDGSLPSFYTEQGMIYSFFQAENSRDLDEIISHFANMVDNYYNLSIVSERKDELIVEYKKSWKLLMFSKNDIQNVVTEFKRSPKAENIFSFVKYTEPNTIYRVKNKLKINFEYLEEAQKVTRDGVFKEMKKIQNISRLTTEKLEPIKINLDKVTNIDDEELSQILQSYREITYNTLMENYFNGEDLATTLKYLLKNRKGEYDMILQYRNSPNTSENDIQKIINYVVIWSDQSQEIINNLE